ncbi:hypothetical protein [Amycolatopsis sp. PS_44_ISF1]|uniref:hypothetical protein n=1 Tax=Amycolatopsis sp. PS_44_ISF1 TaxID=2974917 RepID=UPI0028DFAB81|nr:hypothetical protein [Amycolatopsis sp. PS_44_ISF1]MDT8912749.1 hypothetical protein [Amycolatopsis sp. PS_44_ISF1]
MDPFERYVAAAEAAGALFTSGSGSFVGGEYVDAARGETQFLVTYCDEAAVEDGSLLRRLPAVAAAEAPACTAIVVRLRAGRELPSPWARHVTYVRHRGAAADPAPAEHCGLRIVPAEDGRYEAVIAGWLADAVREAVVLQGGGLLDDQPAEIARQLLATPGRRTFVALADALPIGHATLLCAEEDDVTGEPFAELFDTLVVRGHPRHSEAIAGLVSAAVGHAAELGLPLLGNVIHQGATAPGADPGARVVSMLARSGWAVDHVLWRCAVVGESTPA